MSGETRSSGPQQRGLDSEVINVRPRCTGRDGVEPSSKLRMSPCSQANLPASTLYSLENVGKGGETCQSLLTSENTQQQLVLDMYNNGGGVQSTLLPLILFRVISETQMFLWSQRLLMNFETLHWTGVETNNNAHSHVVHCLRAESDFLLLFFKL